MTTKQHKRLIQSISAFQKMAFYGDRTNFLNKISQVAPVETSQSLPTNNFSDREREQFQGSNQTQGIPAVPSADQSSPITPPPPMNAPAEREKNKAIPKDIQQALVNLGVAAPGFAVDGVWGPQTDAALAQYKQRFKLNPGLTTDQLFNSIRAQKSVGQTAQSVQQAARPFANKPA